MAVQHGYGGSLTNDLIFAYDTLDIKNSYRGVPTTNLVISPDGNANVITIDVPYETDVAGFAQYSSGYFVNPRNTTPTAATGKTFTYSVWMRSRSATPSTYLMYVYTGTGSDGGWWYFGDGPLTQEWRKYSYTRSDMTGTISQVTVYRYNQQGTIDIAAPQIEEKPYSTQFVNGSRSTTQGLLDLTGNRILDLSRISFDSNAQMTFDGTDDTLDTGIPLTDLPALSNFTMECIVKIDAYPTAASPNGYGSTTKAGVLIGAAYYSGTALYWYGNGSGTNCTVYAYIRGNDGYRTAGAYNLTPGQYHHLVLVNDYTNSSINLYANGVLNGTYAGPTQDYNPGLTPSAGNIGINKAQVDGGGTQVYSHLPCLVPITKIYTRALSQAEITQNFKKYQTRFGIS